MHDGRDLCNFFFAEGFVSFFLFFVDFPLSVVIVFLFAPIVGLFKKFIGGSGVAVEGGLFRARKPSIEVFVHRCSRNDRVIAVVFLFHLDRCIVILAMDNPWLACDTRGTKGDEGRDAVFVDTLCHPGKFFGLFPVFEVLLCELTGNAFE